MADEDDRLGLPIEQVGNEPRPEIERDGRERRRILSHSRQIGRQHAMPLLLQQRHHPLPAPRPVPSAVNQDEDRHSFPRG